MHCLKQWNQILRYWLKDILKLQDVIEGIKITKKSSLNCELCTQDKIVQNN